MKILGVYSNLNIQRTHNYANNCSFSGSFYVNPNEFDPSEFEDHGDTNILDLMDKKRGFTIPENPSDWKKYLVEAAQRCDAGNPITDEALKKMDIHALKDIGNKCLKGSVAGATQYVEELKAKGIERFIILCDPEICDIVQECEKHGLSTSALFIPHSDINIKNNLTEFKNRNFVSEWIDAILALRKGNCFVGCEGGNTRTNRFLSIIRTLDPHCKLDLGMLNEMDKDIEYAQEIFKRFSEEDKATLGYTKAFETKLLERFESLTKYRKFVKI